MLLNEHARTFSTGKPVIGCLHMPPLPGTPFYDPSKTLRDHVRQLKGDAKALMDCGFDAAVFANEGDRPYLSKVGPEIVAAYVRIATEVAGELSIPFGCGVLIDPFATLAVAKAIGARFIRTYVSNAYTGVFGVQEFSPAEIFRYQRQIDAMDVRVYTYFEAHAGTCLDTRPLAAMVDSGVQVLPIAGVLMGGPRAGLPPQASALAAIKQQYPEVPVILGSGGTKENIAELLSISDGVIIGTSIKRDGVLWNEIDPARAAAFIEAARKA